MRDGERYSPLSPSSHDDQKLPGAVLAVISLLNTTSSLDLTDIDLSKAHSLAARRTSGSTTLCMKLQALLEKLFALTEHVR